MGEKTEFFHWQKMRYIIENTGFHSFSISTSNVRHRLGVLCKPAHKWTLDAIQQVLHPNLIAFGLIVAVKKKVKDCVILELQKKILCLKSITYLRYHGVKPFKNIHKILVQRPTCETLICLIIKDVSFSREQKSLLNRGLLLNNVLESLLINEKSPETGESVLPTIMSSSKIYRL